MTKSKIVFLWFFASVLIVGTAFSQIPQQNRKFKKLAVEEGLSNSSAQVSLRDKYGRIWIGTRSGLNVFDGFDVTVYRAAEAREHGLTSDYIYDLMEVGDSVLWVATEEGVFTFDYKAQHFTKFPDSTLANSWVTSFYFDGLMYWVGTADGLVKVDDTGVETSLYDSLNTDGLNSRFVWGIQKGGDKVYAMTDAGLNILDVNTGRFEHRDNSNKAIFTELITYSLDMLLSDAGDLWMGSYDFNLETYYIVQYDPVTGEFKSHGSYQNGLKEIYTLVALEEGPDGEIYFGMNGGGLATWDPISLSFSHLMPDDKDPESIFDRDVWNIELDDNGVLWICTDGAGVNYSHPYFSRFEVVANNPYDQQSLAVNDVYAFAETDDHLWVGTNGLGISKMDRSTKIVTNYPFSSDTLRSLWDNTVYALEADSEGKIWVGSYSGGLSQFDPRTETFKHVYNDRVRSPLLSNFNDALTRDGDWIWVGSAQGLYKINSGTYQVMHHNRLPAKSRGFGDVIESIFLEGDRVWAASDLGLFMVDKLNGRIDSTHTPLDTMYVKGVAKVSNGDMWFATTSGLVGLKDGQYTLLDESDGISNNDLRGLVADSQDRLWVPSANGLNLFDTKTSQNFVFRKEDGLPGDQWNDRSIRRGSSGQVYIGGLNGFVIIDPEEISIRQSQPNVFFKKLESIKSDHTDSYVLLGVPEVDLSYSDDFLSVSFFNDEIILPEKTRYQYRIPGIDENRWIELNEPNLSFTDLGTGVFTLEVRASNFDGIFGDATQLLIRVAPPWWATGYAYTGYILILISLLLGRDQYLRKEKRKLENTVRERTTEIRQQKEKAEDDKETIEKQAKRLAELDQVKTRFFSNISHEFRTPLTLIKGPVDAILGGKVKGQERIDRNLALVQKNSATLSKLIDEILDLNKIETGQILLHSRPLNLHDTLQALAENYEFICAEKQLSWNFQTSGSLNCMVLIDSLRLEHILNNLVSNAAKHARESVSFDISFTDNRLNGSVTDDGEGIEEDELPQIFDRFYQTSYGAMIPHSSGIGLAYVKEIVVLMNGQIHVESKPGQGTTFRFSIPVETLANDIANAPEQDFTLEVGRYPHGNNKVLIVEDNPEMRDFINEVIGEEFEVETAENGVQALEALKEFKADLVISDVMMPKMNGMELLERLKSDTHWKYLSFVMLTAKKSEDLKIEALSLGLDDYLTKPFNPIELEIRVKNLLGNQFERSNWLMEQPNSIDEEVTIEPIIESSHAYISENLSDANLDVPSLARHLALSERQLTRVVKRACGLTPALLIREVRLLKARENLEVKRFASVSETAYAAGFSKPSYFTKLYSERFGKKPSEYFISA